MNPTVKSNTPSAAVGDLARAVRVAGSQPRRPGVVAVGTVLLVCLCTYWSGLWISGLNQSEGQRAIPGWEMLDRGGWFTTRLFEQLYLRKPPGVPWAIAFSSAFLGQTEFAARAVSAFAATLACLLTTWMSRRWFGSWLGAAVAGSAQALTPFLWPPGRSCEIEALNNFATQVVVLMLVDVLVARPSSTLSLRRAAPIALGVLAAAMFKGPASVPCVIGSIVGCGLAGTGSGVLRNRTAQVGVVAGLAMVGVSLLILARAGAATGETPVLQGPGRFLWRSDSFLEIITLPASALIAALPWSLVLAAPWLLSRRGRGPTRQNSVAGALVFSTLAALAIYTIIGVSNVRYAMPAVVALFPLIALATRELRSRWQTGATQHAAQAFIIGGLVATALLAAVYIPMEEARRFRNSGRESGRRLAAALAPLIPAAGAEIHGDQWIDTRPEVLWYARRELASRGIDLRVRWTPSRHRCPIPAPGHFIVLRTDGLDEYENELADYESAGRLASLRPVFADGVHPSGGAFKFRYQVYEVLADTQSQR